MADWDLETITELHESTSVEEIQTWLETCEESIEARQEQSARLAWERVFLGSCRLKFQDGVKAGKERPLGPKYLVWLKSLYDKVE